MLSSITIGNLDWVDYVLLRRQNPNRARAVPKLDIQDSS